MGLVILYNTPTVDGYFLNFQVTSDSLSYLVAFVVTLFALIVFIISNNYYRVANIKTYDHLVLLLLSLIGLCAIASSFDLITLYLAIELQSLCFYIITNFKFNSHFSMEAGLKYFILGAVSSGILLFGISLIYGYTGMTNYSDLKGLFHGVRMEDLDYSFYKIILIGVIFLLCGLLFKIGIVPFHVWVSDIYESAPTNIALFFAVIPQISIIAAILRLNIIFLSTFYDYLYIFFAFLSVITVTVGTFGAIYQTKLKRIFAFSSISNMGYLLSLMCCLDIECMAGALFYIIVYNLITLGMWSILLTFRNSSTGVALKDLSDLILLYNSNKFLALVLIIFLFSGMGIPPLMGFFSKFYLFLNLLDSELYFLLFYFIVLSSIGVFYHLRLIVLMVSLKSKKYVCIDDPGELKMLIMMTLASSQIYFALYPSHLMIICHNIITTLLLF